MNMKRGNVWLVCILLYLSVSASAQVIKVENGIASTTCRIDGASLGTMHPYQMAIGIDYWDHSWFDLSSNIGYIAKGSKDKNLPVYKDGEFTPFTTFYHYADYLTLNTTFRVKKNIRNETYYIGTGPRIDIKLKDHLLLDNSFNTVLYGLKCEAGFIYTVNKIQLGLNAAYLPTFNKQIEEVRERTFSFGLSIGYILL